VAVGWGRAGYGTDYWGATSVSVTLGTLAITSALGTPVIQPDCNVSVTGLASTSGIGALTVDCEANVTVGTLAITSAIGSVIVYENEVINLPTLAITSGQGTASTDAEANANITVSLAITSNTGVVLVWGEIDESQTPSYSAIDESQTPSWTEVA